MPTALLRRTVAQLFAVGIPGPELDRATRTFLSEYRPGGIVLFRRNVRSAGQLRRLVTGLHASGAGVRPLVGIDHEGGRVHRLPRPFTHFPPAATVALGPGIAITSRPLSRQARTNRYPGSDTAGVPASLTRATRRPA